MLRSLIASIAIMLPTAGVANPAAAPRTLALAGIEAFAPSAAAETALIGAGFTRTVSRDDLSFKGKVELAVSQAQGNTRTAFSRAVNYQTWKKGGEEINLWFLQLPEGPVIKNVIYMVPTSSQSPDQVLTELTRRFGTPDVTAQNKLSGKAVHWCKRKSPTLCDMSETNLMMTVINNQVTLRLNVDDRREKMTEAAVQAEARKLAGGASF